MKKATVKFWIVFCAASIVGYLLARLDTSEHWDDTGVMAAAILLSAFLFGSILPVYAWLWAFLIGGTIYCFNVFKSGNYGSFIAILFALIGSYSGFGVRKYILKRKK